MSCPLKQVQAFSNARRTVRSINKAEGEFYLPVHVEAELIDQAVQPLSTKFSLYLGEDRLNWVKFGTVRHVPDWLHVELRKAPFDFFRTMDLQIVHKDSKRLFFELDAQFPKKHDEVFCIDCGGMN